MCLKSQCDINRNRKGQERNINSNNKLIYIKESHLLDSSKSSQTYMETGAVYDRTQLPWKLTLRDVSEVIILLFPITKSCFRAWDNLYNFGDEADVQLYYKFLYMVPFICYYLKRSWVFWFQFLAPDLEYLKLTVHPDSQLQETYLRKVTGIECFIITKGVISTKSHRSQLLPYIEGFLFKCCLSLLPVEGSQTLWTICLENTLLMCFKIFRQVKPTLDITIQW